MKKLTKREKVLIYILVCFGLLMGGFYLVVFPGYQKYQTLSNQLTEAEFQQNTMASAIESVPTVMETRDQANVKLSGLKGPYLAHLPNEGLDSLLTQLCLDYYLKPSVLAVETNAWQGVATFVEAPAVYATTPDQVVGSGNTSTTTEPTTGTSAKTPTGTPSEAPTVTSTETPTGTTAVDSGSTPTWTGVVTMTLTGAQYDFQQLIDAVDARTDMIISAYDIVPEALPETGTSGNTTTTSSGFAPELDGGNITINVTFIVYMVDK
ncbi:hypothetical protein [Acetobacterium sp.]|uniref:hypothetical protein n=1 Tax=Acetobacterium sp. TaxID=1872094 RepID=UPI002F409173